MMRWWLSSVAAPPFTSHEAPVRKPYCFRQAEWARLRDSLDPIDVHPEQRVQHAGPTLQARHRNQVATFQFRPEPRLLRFARFAPKVGSDVPKFITTFQCLTGCNRYQPRTEVSPLPGKFFR